MKTPNILTYSFALALSLNLSALTGQAFATKLNATPLPHERDLKNFTDGQEVLISPTATSFPRRPDRAELDRRKKEEAEAAAKK
ncbi:MAG TPA: hypothetical protein V6C72_17130, partial [Chroococcales cyanobacterium]